MSRCILLAALGIFVVAGPARAQDRVRISSYAGVHVADDDRFLEITGPESGIIAHDIDDGPIVGVRITVPASGPFRGELTYGRTSTEMVIFVPTIEDPLGSEPFSRPFSRETYTSHLLEFGVQWLPWTGRAVEPFLTVAPGVAFVTGGIESDFLDVDEEVTESEVGVAVGAGVGLLAGARWGVRVDLRDHLTFCRKFCVDDQVLHGFELSGGLQISF